VISFATNVAALQAHRYLTLHTAAANRASMRLASGRRINSAADDPAGMTVATGLRAQIGAMTQAVQNSTTALNIVQIAEGGLSQSTAILQQMLSLAVQAQNSGSQTPSSLAAIQAQIQQMKSQLTSVANGTNFNGAKLLDGSFTGKQFQVGAGVGDSITVSIAGATATQLGVGTIDVTGTAPGSMTANASNATITSSSTVTTTIASPAFGAGGTSWANLNGTISMNGVSLDLTNIKSSNGGTPAMADLQAALTATFGTNGSGASNVTASVSGTSGQLVITGPATSFTNNSSQLAAISLQFTQESGAEGAFNAINNAINSVSSIRAVLGGTHNQFQYQINNLNQAITTTTGAESGIRDADFALEEANLARAQVLQQSAASMLAQANQFPQTVYKILFG
jgi:flagellin